MGENGSSPGTGPAAAGLLRWYRDAGVDEVVGEAPVSRFRQPATPQPAPGPPTGGRLAALGPTTGGRLAAGDPPVVGPPAGEQLVSVPAREAARVAAEAASLDELRTVLAAFDGCRLKQTATSMVFGRGNPHARLVMIGEAPGAEEDVQGLPFVGASGRLLDRMLASIGVTADGVFISNTVFWRPPGNRSPSSAEVAVCQPFVARLIELVAPDVLVALGGPAATALFGLKEGISRARGRWLTYQSPRLERPIAAIAMFHPAYLLRSPAQKRLAWRDLLALKEKFQALKNPLSA